LNYLPLQYFFPLFRHISPEAKDLIGRLLKKVFSFDDIIIIRQYYFIKLVSVRVCSLIGSCWNPTEADLLSVLNTHEETLKTIALIHYDVTYFFL